MREHRIESDRAQQIAFCAIQLLRKELRKEFHDWKDADDYIFSELDLEESELKTLFAPYPHADVYTGSCHRDGDSKKDFDVRYYAFV